MGTSETVSAEQEAGRKALCLDGTMGTLTFKEYEKKRSWQRRP